MVDTKTKYFFKEWDLLSYSSIYSFFNDLYYIEKFKNEWTSENYFDYDTNKVLKYLDRIMSKKNMFRSTLFHKN